MNLTIGFAGMTHLGLVSAAAAASKGFEVIGYDTDSKLIDALNNGELPVLEPGLPELVADNRKALSFTADPAALGRCDLLYLAVDVPTDAEGRSDLDAIRRMIAHVAPVLGREAALVVLSQVSPGFTRALAMPPERLYYQVETLVFGRAVQRATTPERIILGCADPEQALPAALASYLAAFNCVVLPMRYESAELAKIAINCCLVASITVANTLAELCENIGADWAEIAPALKLDSRIGSYAYLTPGLGIAGGNLERDLRTVITLADAEGTDAGVVRAWIANSTRRKDWTWQVLNETVLAKKPDARIAILGLAYKENTHSTKNSPAIALLDRLRGRMVAVHDPVVSAAVVPWARAASDPLDTARDADVLVIATPWPQYHSLAAAELARIMRGRTILDPYRVLDGKAFAAAGFVYLTLGAAPLVPGDTGLSPQA
jgi:UDPglucose 6-dehydrogenase